MKARWIVVSLGVAMLIAAKGLTAGQNETASKEFKATCPVSGKPAGETHLRELKTGEKVYFCCDNCPKAFDADPKKFNLQVHRQLLETGQVVQVACPFTGKPVNAETLVDVGQTKAGFCCKNCLAKYEKADDEAKLTLMFTSAAMKKGFTNQTKCPVSGKPIKAEHVVEFKGEKVYFCCPNCPAAFEKEPDKFLAKLPQFNKDKSESSEN